MLASDYIQGTSVWIKYCFCFLSHCLHTDVYFFFSADILFNTTWNENNWKPTARFFLNLLEIFEVSCTINFLNFQFRNLKIVNVFQGQQYPRKKWAQKGHNKEKNQTETQSLPLLFSLNSESQKISQESDSIKIQIATQENNIFPNASICTAILWT